MEKMEHKVKVVNVFPRSGLLGGPRSGFLDTETPIHHQSDLVNVSLRSLPADDWCRTWATGNTIMLRRTSKRLKETVDQMLLPVVVRLTRIF